MTTETPTRQLVTVPLDQVQDNPWQPRAELAGVEELAQDIATNGLMQPPLVRTVRLGVYQTVFGHRRIAAMRHLGWTHAEVEVRNLTDEQMALMALSENVQRRDLKPLEVYRAWARALAEIPGMTIEKLAESVKLARPTVSNNLRILQLPDYILALVDDGTLSAHGAREFLCLRGADGHFHDNIAKAVLDVLTRGAPDWRHGRIRWEIKEAIRKQSVSDFRRLFRETPEDWGNGGADPAFDVGAFLKEHYDRVHSIPSDRWGGRYQTPTSGRLEEERSVDWTCATSAWVKYQKAALASQPAPATSGAGGRAPQTQGRSRDFATTLKADPVYAASGLPLTFGKDGSVSWETGLADDVAEQLGTRATPQLLTKRSKEFRAHVDARELGYDDRPGYYTGEGYTEPPTYFPFAECRERCVQGATYARFDPKRPFFLWCLNKAHYEALLAQGRDAARAVLLKQVAPIDAEDAALLATLEAAAWEIPATSPILRPLAVSLLRSPVFAPVSSERAELLVWPENVTRVFFRLGLEPPQQVDRWDRTYAPQQLALPAGLDDEAVKELVLRLLVNHHRNNPEAFDAKALDAALQAGRNGNSPGKEKGQVADGSTPEAPLGGNDLQPRRSGRRREVGTGAQG